MATMGGEQNIKASVEETIRECEAGCARLDATLEKARKSMAELDRLIAKTRRRVAATQRLIAAEQRTLAASPLASRTCDTEGPADLRQAASDSSV